MDQRDPTTTKGMPSRTSSYESYASLSSSSISKPQYQVNEKTLETGTNGWRPRLFSGLEPRTSESSFFRWWLPETIASVISVVSLVSLALVLRHYDGRSVQGLDLPYALTLNGIVAAISTINRVALMVPVGAALSQEAWLWLSSNSQKPVCYSRLDDLERSDAASRGAWGSIVLLCKSGRRYTAWFGAFVTILSLAFGTFTQQLLAFETFPISAGRDSLVPGNIPRSQAWAYATGNEAENTLSTSLAMKAATHNGILAQNISPLTASCPTGNCTWPITPSMAVCGECTYTQYQTHCNATSCNYTMPSGSIMTTQNGYGTYPYAQAPGFQLASTEGAIYNSSDLERLYIANFDIFGAHYNSLLSQPWQNKSMVACECALWMCVQAYEVSSLSSYQVQSIAQSFSQLKLRDPADTVSNLTFQALPAAMNPGPGPGPNYTVDWNAWAALGQYLPSIFKGQVWLGIEGQTYDNDFVQAVWNASASGNLDKWVKNLAGSMTNVVRIDTPMSNAMYNGTGYQLGVNVRWAWLTLPLAMVLLSILLLVVVVVRTAWSPIGAWKGSPLALLFMDIDHEIERKANGQKHTFDSMDGSLRRTNVVLGTQLGGKWVVKAA